MFRAQLLFFFPLAVATSIVTWLGRSYPLHYGLRRYLALVLAGWLGATGLLYVITSFVTPSDGLRDVPVLLGAYSLPVAAAAIATPTIGRRWSPESRILLTLALSAAAGFLAPLFLLLSACTIQSSCL